MDIRKTETFTEWLDALTDLTGRSRILMWIERLRGGDFGDSKSVGDGIGQLRITSGPGYRVYFTKVGTEIVILLAGGDKKFQVRDIPKEKAMAKQLEDIK